MDGDDAASAGWRALLRREWMATIAVVLGGILLHSMNVLLVATILPSVVREVGGAAMLAWPTTAFLASSIVAASCTAILAARLGAGRTFCVGAVLFGLGAVISGLAPSMAQIVAGRFAQGFGGGLLSAMAYVLVRSVFPAPLWPRMLALLAGVWSVSVLLGPLLGGVFASYADWRMAFFTVAVLAAALAAGALHALPRTPSSGSETPAVPGGRIGLICLGIIAVSLAGIIPWLGAKAAAIALALGALVLMLRLDRRAAQPLLPRDAFSLASPTGVGLWLAMLLSVTFSPLQIFAPVFLQSLHGLDPLAAGYTVAVASMAWTAAALSVAGLTGRWPDRLFIAGPLLMLAGLCGFALLMPAAPVAAVLPAIALLGGGIGSCWTFTAQRVMASARDGEGDVAAASVATVQQVGIAFGAAAAGLIANAVGFAAGGAAADVAPAAFWIPACFMLAAAAAAAMGARLGALSRR